MSLQRFIDMRYLGQWRSMAIPVEAPLDLPAAIARFHDEHDREHSYRRDGAPVEIYRLTLRANGVTPKPELARHERGGKAPEPIATRPVRFDESDAVVETPVYARFDIPAGTVLTGPAVLEQLDSTVLVPPGVEAEVDDWLNVVLGITEANR
jgi:N-methylhydantoinase A